MSDKPTQQSAAYAFATKEIFAERIRQEIKWGEQNHDPFTYLTILMEEVGETSQAALECRFGKGTSGQLMTEAIQTAAVAMALVECLHREKWSWPNHD